MTVDGAARRLYQHRRVLETRESESETIVFRVRADPEPRDDFALTDAERAMVLADSYHTDAIPPFLEFQGLMERVPLPEPRISSARVSESLLAVRRSASRTARAFCRSREILKTTGANVRLNLLGDRTKTAVVGEVVVDLAIPSRVAALPDKGGELRQFISGEFIYGSLYFGETHGGSVLGTEGERNSPVCPPLPIYSESIREQAAESGWLRCWQIGSSGLIKRTDRIRMPGFPG